MDANEFETWVGKLESLFPQTAEWLLKRPPVMESWERAFHRLPLADAVTALKRMFEGEAEKPKAYDREDWPAFVLAICNRISSQRIDQKERTEREADMKARSRGNFPAGQLLREILQRKKDGESHDDAVNAVLSRYKPAEGTIHEQRVFRCPTCEDSGRIEVWHPLAVEQAKRGETPQRRICATACNECRLGEHAAKDRETKRETIRGLPQFADWRFCRFEERKSIKANRVALAAFIARPAGQPDDEFAKFNRGEF